MSSNSGLEMNKIAAAVLLAGLVAMIVGTVTGELYHGAHKEGHEEAKRGYTIESAETADAGAGAEAAPTGPVDIAPYMSVADVKLGEDLLKRCTTCHTFEKGGANKPGPNQYGLVGSNIAHKGDFAYSDSLKAMHSKKWGFQELSEFLENPKKFAPGNKMAYAGLKKPEERAALIAYINTLSDSPLPIPKVDFPKPEETAPAEGAKPEAGKDAKPAEQPDGAKAH